MENKTLKFMHIIYNQDTETIAFVHLGKPTIKARLKHNSAPCNQKRNNYAFKPRTIEEFLFFLENTELAPSRNYNDFSFKCFRVRPFNWVATRFASKFIDSPDNLRLFIHRCNLIKQEKLNKPIKNAIERE